MSLNETLTNDLKTAMKAGKKDELTIIRMLKSNLMNEKIKLGHELSDDEAAAVVNREIKQHLDSIEQFKAGAREDLVEQQEKEMKILKKYAPKQMSPEKVAEVVKETVEQLGATGKSDFGKVMGAVMGKVRGKADGNDVKKAVNDQLK
ncbi:GatB/YqeY domain-containing protein [Fructilactobacillus sp. Tb1]|uniref:GatB/YqeY domain-containing protein n=1 Tax=Fructilactobacillus sp. Tb1 TaxID=3422304 RepID=UPI003D2ADE7E